MQYRTIGLMSGSSLDGLDLCYAQFTEKAGEWTYSIEAAQCIPYPPEWQEKLKNAILLPTREYLKLHTGFGNYLADQVLHFIQRNQLSFKVQLISSHGHTVFHDPTMGYTAQIGDGAILAARTGIPVVSDLRSVDVALGGQGAPIVPLGERLLFPEYSSFLNLGGIANISWHNPTGSIHAFDLTAANQVLNYWAQKAGFDYDADGKIAATGNICTDLLESLNSLSYFHQSAPKSLDNSFSKEYIIPIMEKSKVSIPDALATYQVHLAVQLADYLKTLPAADSQKILVTGGGAYNQNLIQVLQKYSAPLNWHLIVPDSALIEFKEALIMGLLGILRWREEPTVLHSVTGASRNSVGGALWAGHSQ